MSGALYTHTTRATGTTLTAAIYNADHTNHITNGDATQLGGYSGSAAQMAVQTDPGEPGSESLAASISDELERLRFAVYEMKRAIDQGVTVWYATPTQSQFLINVRTSAPTTVSGQGVLFTQVTGRASAIAATDPKSPVELYYRGDNDGLAVQLTSKGQVALPPWYIDGLEVAVRSSSPGYIEVATGVCRSANNLINMRVTTPLHRTVTAQYSAGTATGGARATGLALSAKGTLHVFLVHTSASAFDIGVDTAINAANLLATVSGTYYRRLGSVICATNTANGCLAQEMCPNGEVIYYDTQIESSNPSWYVTTHPSVNPPTMTLTALFAIPSGHSVKAKLRYSASAIGTAESGWYIVGARNRTPTTLPASVSAFLGVPYTIRAASFVQTIDVWTNTNRQIGVQSFPTTANTRGLRLMAIGYHDMRRDS